MDKSKIQPVDPKNVNIESFKKRIACALILTHDSKILLQMRGEDKKDFPGMLGTFGGKIEGSEEPIHALIREIKEELGAQISEDDVTSFGAITEEITGHSELLYCYFWHDVSGKISACYEGSPVYFDSCEEVLKHPKTMDYVIWLMEKSSEKIGMRS